MEFDHGGLTNRNAGWSNHRRIFTAGQDASSGKAVGRRKWMEMGESNKPQSSIDDCREGEPPPKLGYFQMSEL